MRKPTKQCLGTQELSAFIDQELPASREMEVVAHLELCADCRQTEKQLRQIRTNLFQCRSVSPRRDLWPQIDQRIVAKPTRFPAFPRRFVRLAPLVAAAAAVAVVVGLFFGQQTGNVPTPPKQAAIDHAFASAQQAERTYREAIGSLEKVLDGEKASLDPQTVKIVQQSLAEIEGVISRCRVAMKSNPGSMEAHWALLAAYREKMDFLFELVGSRIRPLGV